MLVGATTSVDIISKVKNQKLYKRSRIAVRTYKRVTQQVLKRINAAGSKKSVACPRSLKNGIESGVAN